MFPAAVATDRGGGGGREEGRGGERRAAFDAERATRTDGGGMESIYNLLPRVKEETVSIAANLGMLLEALALFYECK